MIPWIVNKIDIDPAYVYHHNLTKIKGVSGLEVFIDESCSRSTSSQTAEAAGLSEGTDPQRETATWSEIAQP